MLENKRDYSKEAAKSGVVRGGLKNNYTGKASFPISKFHFVFPEDAPPL